MYSVMSRSTTALNSVLLLTIVLTSIIPSSSTRPSTEQPNLRSSVQMNPAASTRLPVRAS